MRHLRTFSCPWKGPLYKIPVKPKITDTVSLGDGSGIPADMLHDIVFVDRCRRHRPAGHIQRRDFQQVRPEKS
jgi:hypothetical protein